MSLHTDMRLKEQALATIRLSADVGHAARRIEHTLGTSWRQVGACSVSPGPHRVPLPFWSVNHDMTASRSLRPAVTVPVRAVATPTRFD